MKTLFLKDSSNRRKQFALTTRICVENGKKVVIKEPSFPEGIPHIKRIVESQRLFAQYYQNVEISKTWIKNDMLYAEFVDGVPLSDLYIKAIQNNDKDELLRLIKYHVELMMGQNNSCKFIKTDEFVKIFGETNIFDKNSALEFTFFEASPENIVFLGGDENSPCFIDCEWFFDFPIPVSLLKFRIAQQLSFLSGIDDIVSFDEMLTITDCDLTSNEGIVFLMNFFDSLYKENSISYLNLGKEFEKNILPYLNIIHYNSTLYIDAGNGYSENGKTVHFFTGNEVEISCPIPKNTVAVRLDPVEGHGCVISNLEILSYGGIVKYEPANGFMDEAGNMVFTNTDPQINLHGAAYWLKIRYRILLLSDFSHYRVLGDYITTTQERDGLVAERDGYINSRSWRFTRPLRKFTAFIRRNKVLYFFAKGIKGAVKKVRDYIYNRRQLLTQSAPVINNTLPHESEYQETPIKTTARKYVKKNKRFYFPVLNFPVFEIPVVSIIIPVYNQFEYTYNCLKSILKNSADVKYEIIIADDNSADKTKKIGRIIKNVKIVRNKKNLGFLGNCNNASKFAKGKYFLFLNNDTEAQENWLSPLIELMERDESIGLTGSKLIYPDGTLQEAGGIIWSNGAGHNYGNGFDSGAPEFNYVRDVDYISGASIMVRRTLWEKFGGFDEVFTPAYYEDADLAFQIREAGFRVVYQPASVVMHFEGKSHGTDTNMGQKSYQIANNKKFIDKWHNVLEKEHFMLGEKMFLARGDRGKKVILFIDRYVPHYDKDAGSRTDYMYIKLFLQLGLKVVFLGEDTHPFQPYTLNFQQMGVEILYGEHFADNWTAWIKENGIFLDYVFTCRSHVSIKYIDYLKQYTTAKIIYYNHDMGHLRYYRQYEITKDPVSLATAKCLEKLEMEISHKADVLYVVGSNEKNILGNLFPCKPVYNIPAYFFESINKKDFFIQERKNLLFVGGFDHAPNEDAVLWFYENAFPEIAGEYPDIIWYIVGSNPTKKLLSIHDEHVVLTGYVTEEQLKHYYNTCRICIAPLRFGAGVKGKVIEAAYYQTPMITTNIGAEGISLEENAFVVNPPDNTFAKAVIDLYKDEEKLKELSLNCSKFINNHFSISHAIDIVKQEIKI
jgi:GT2 family glycosyltransferase